LTETEKPGAVLEEVDRLESEIARLKAGIHEVRKDIAVGRIPRAITSLRELEEE
jgi:hypothetical protein